MSICLPLVNYTHTANVVDVVQFISDILIKQETFIQVIARTCLHEYKETAVCVCYMCVYVIHVCVCYLCVL